MIWSDKAFGIYMGHAGEEARVFVQDDAPIEVRSFDDTQVVALARHDVKAFEAGRRGRSQARDHQPEGIAA
jgi:hypothetical protein